MIISASFSNTFWNDPKIFPTNTIALTFSLKSSKVSNTFLVFSNFEIY